MESELIQKHFKFVWYADSMREAHIIFEYDKEDSLFVFESCIFKGVSKGAYDYDDWQFLNALSKEILLIAENERGQ